MFKNLNAEYEINNGAMFSGNRDLMYLYAVTRCLRETVPTEVRNEFLSKLTNVSNEELELIMEMPFVEPEKSWYNWPKEGETMTGQQNLESLIKLSQEVINNKIEGDIVETGIWRGGCSILLRLCFDILEKNNSRMVYACDSLEGCPVPTTEKDEGDTNYSWNHALAQDYDTVLNNFKKYGANNVKLIKGWFKDTIPPLKNEIEKIAILRMDGDSYTSTMDVLDNLYDKVVSGGYIISDDLGLKYCKLAFDDFEKKRNIKFTWEEATSFSGQDTWDGVFISKKN